MRITRNNLKKFLRHQRACHEGYRWFLKNINKRPLIEVLRAAQRHADGSPRFGYVDWLNEILILDAGARQRQTMKALRKLPCPDATYSYDHCRFLTPKEYKEYFGS